MRMEVPVAPRARMERLPWRGFVRVIFPRIVVPTEGRRGPEEREMERIGVLEGLVVEGTVVSVPAMLA